MRSYAASRLESEREGGNIDNQLPGCLAHYIHFFHLFIVALNNGIPHVQIEMLLLVKSVSDIMDVLRESRICSASSSEDQCTQLAETIFHDRQNKTSVHSDSESLIPGIDLSTSIYRRKERQFLKQTTCHDVLQDIIAFCGDHISGCQHVNEMYGYNSSNAWLSALELN